MRNVFDLKRISTILRNFRQKMATEKLPSCVDVVVMGTGLSESMVSASLSRIGKKILHVDKNDYYGSHWTTFSFKDLRDWCHEDAPSQTIEKQNDKEMTVPLFDDFVMNKIIKSYIKENNEVEEFESKSDQAASEGSIVNNSTIEDDTQTISFENTYDAEPENLETVSEGDMHKSNVKSNDALPVSAGNEEQRIVECIPESYKTNEITDTTNSSDIVNLPKKVKKPQLSIVSQAKLNSKSPDISIEDFEILSRKFNLDLSPKFLYSAGPLVQSILKANISHYAEFKVVDRILTSKDGAIIEVPCNRSDVFGSTFLSMIEKRMLMKFLTFCVELDFESPSDELKEIADKSFQDFLRSRRLTDNLQRFVIYSIAMVKPDVPTVDALRETCLFLQSLNRYGKSPFIWPLFGVGELPQSFCRMSAVFGSIFCLQRPASLITIDESTDDGSTIKVNLGGEIIECKHLVVNRSYIPSQYISSEQRRANISKAILITNASVLPSSTEHVSFLTIPPLAGREELVRVIELGASSSACPSGLFVLYLMVLSTSDAHTDLVDYTKLLTKTDEEDGGNSSCKPCLLWSVYFNEVANNADICELPDNVFVTCMPGSSLGFSDVVFDAERIFKKICPTEEFMMKVPNSEDIIWDTDEQNDETKGDQSTSSNDISANNNDQSASNNDKSASSNDQSANSNDKSTSNNDQSVSNNDKSISINDQSVSNNDQSVSNNDKSISNNDKSISNNDKSTL